MPDVRFVCLSDLHFGAENSIMSSLAPGTVEVDPDVSSPVMTGLIDCLESLISRNESPVKPTLILCGDILELALAHDNVAATVFSDFVARTFGPNRQLFDDLIYFIPGNHDHHLWEGARERQYADYVRARPVNQQLETPWHTTRMRTRRDEHPVDSELLTALIQRKLGTETPVTVRSVYPNLALTTDDLSRAAIFHHGHYVEGMYTLMSSLKRMLFPDQEQAADIWDWEAENFAWIDFFWSTLGRSGAFGADVSFIYATLQSPTAMKPLLHNLALGMVDKTRGPAWLHRLEAGPLGWALERVAARASRLERNVPAGPLSSRAESGLKTYLEVPLLRQAKTEYGEELPRSLSFVFGHTHKPFECVQTPDGYPTDVNVYNTGGWVVDTTGPNLLQGAAAILLDENLATFSLRLYNQAAAGATPGPVRVATTTQDAGGEFPKRISSLVDAEAQPWKGLATAAAALVHERHEALQSILGKA